VTAKTRTRRNPEFLIRTIEDFDRISPPSPGPQDEAPDEVDEDPEAFGRRLGEKILRDAFEPLREELRRREKDEA
jgi:hypothetical protein